MSVLILVNFRWATSGIVSHFKTGWQSKPWLITKNTIVISRQHNCNTYKRTNQKDEQNKRDERVTFWKVAIWRVSQSIREGGGHCEITLDYGNDEVAIIS